MCVSTLQTVSQHNTQPALLECQVLQAASIDLSPSIKSRAHVTIQYMQSTKRMHMTHVSTATDCMVQHTLLFGCAGFHDRRASMLHAFRHARILRQESKTERRSCTTDENMDTPHDLVTTSLQYRRLVSNKMLAAACRLPAQSHWQKNDSPALHTRWVCTCGRCGSSRVSCSISSHRDC